MKKNIQNVNFIKVFRIALSSCLAILLATLFGLQYSSSAGIIAFLSTQDTKKETIGDIIKRCLSYILSVVLSLIIFKFCGYNTPAFGLFLFFLVSISYYLKWDSVLSSSAVVSTHFLLERNHAPALLLNELLLLFIGVGTAMLMNLFIANNTKSIKKDINRIESEFSSTFMEMSKYILNIDASSYDMVQLDALQSHLDKSHRRAISNRNNDFFSDSNYYISYMEARIRQSETMLRIVHSMHTLTQVPFSAIELSHFMKQISTTLHLRNNTLGLLDEYEALNQQFDNFPIPQSRKEFESLAHIHDILIELGYFLNVKKEFVESLSYKQIKRYWAEGGLFS